jgi:hypothetical protein
VALAQALPTSSTVAAAPTSAWTTSNGGTSWTPPKLAHTSEAWAWAGAAGGPLVYLLDGSARSYAVSTDSGATFTDQPFRR